MPTNDRKPVRLPSAVHAHLADALGGQPQFAGATEGHLPGGERLTVFHAVAAERPNTVVAVVAAAEGTLTPKAEFTASLGHDPFIPHFDLPVLGTVPTGTAPKADVYLLADTTGSMTPVIDAVKAGAGAILNDPSLAAFDVA